MVAGTNKKEVIAQKRIHQLTFVASLLLATSCFSQDAVADNMLLYQRSIGGWPKAVNEVVVNYNKSLSAEEKESLQKDKGRSDATIDNGATTKEIRYLLRAYKTTGNTSYKTSAEGGIRYLLQMQKWNGGFPQFYPDSSFYRGQITYNDNAMINALNVLWDVAYNKNDFIVEPMLVAPAKAAIDKGIDCILKTQIVTNGKRTGWCAQHDKKTLQPVKARAFELASLSGMETVGIVNFLMKVQQPSPQIVNAINSAVQWLESAKVTGYKVVEVEDKSLPKGKDRVVVKDDASTIWARFYDLETGKPFFCGRDGVKKANLSEIEVERRTGYAWYGEWPKKLLEKDYPEWQKKNNTAAIETKKVITVSLDGKGDFTSIQAAINSLPDSSATQRVIWLKKGIYREKLFIAKHNIALIGEDREATVITQDIARDEWRCEHKDDWGVATLNLNGDDITLVNLTIANDYGFNFKEPRTVVCTADTISHKKTITRNSHQMALRSMQSTRLKAINCRFRAWAGDTVSPWNLEDGAFYFKDCYMEGGVDFYCPRGNAWAENCRFYTNTGDAAIWHDGSNKPSYKTVLKNCSFDGFAGFSLGRYHKDAQFYLIDCHFSKNMADRDIYLVPTANKMQWGRRVYYSNCKREGGNYPWFADNLQNAAGSPASKDITVDWLFGGKWQPEKEAAENSKQLAKGYR